jgi:hypothetical protein
MESRNWPSCYATCWKRLLYIDRQNFDLVIKLLLNVQSMQHSRKCLKLAWGLLSNDCLRSSRHDFSRRWAIFVTYCVSFSNRIELSRLVIFLFLMNSFQTVLLSTCNDVVWSDFSCLYSATGKSICISKSLQIKYVCVLTLLSSNKC